MKKRVLSLTLVLMLCAALVLTVHAAPTTGFVEDEADLLTESEEAALSARLQQLSSTYNAQIVVATVESTGGSYFDDYMEFLYDERSLGYGENRDGVLLLVSMDPRTVGIVSNGFAGDAITTSSIDIITEAMVDDLSEGNYADAFDIFADECVYYLDGYLNGFPFDTGTNLMVALGIGILIGVIVASVLKGQLKTVRRQHQADVYVKPGSMQLRVSSDLFLYRTVNRVKKQNNNSSSGKSGSSRSVGSRSF